MDNFGRKYEKRSFLISGSKLFFILKFKSNAHNLSFKSETNSKTDMVFRFNMQTVKVLNAGTRLMK